jgi:hypothetical protein
MRSHTPRCIGGVSPVHLCQGIQIFSLSARIESASGGRGGGGGGGRRGGGGVVVGGGDAGGGGGGCSFRFGSGQRLVASS